MARARDLLAEFFGDWHIEERGMHFYSSRCEFEGGAKILFGGERNREFCTVELSGSVLGTIAGFEVIDLVSKLANFGFGRVNRLDIAVDWKGTGLRLVDAVVEGYHAGELVGSRSCRDLRGWKKPGCADGSTVYFGKRGSRKGSGRYVRVYDKGLEQGGSVAGEWHRWEAELSGDVAERVLSRIVDAFRGGDRWESEAVRLGLGAVDFREPRRGGSLKRRPRSAWWAEVVDSFEPEMVRARRVRFECLESTARWVASAVVPTLVGMSRAVGRSVEDVLGDLVGVPLCRVAAASCRSVHEYAASLRFSMRGGVLESGFGDCALE